MRLVARMHYSGVPKDLELKELPADEFDIISSRMVTGIPVYYSRSGTNLRFWPTRNPAYCSIVDLDFSKGGCEAPAVILKKGEE